jgi:hypothetical protein
MAFSCQSACASSATIEPIFSTYFASHFSITPVVCQQNNVLRSLVKLCAAHQSADSFGERSRSTVPCRSDSGSSCSGEVVPTGLVGEPGAATTESRSAHSCSIPWRRSCTLSRWARAAMRSMLACSCLTCECIGIRACSQKSRATSQLSAYLPFRLQSPSLSV